uniref:MHC class II antigen beta chain n=2 Tax=Channichthyidae TaxID=30806 RepID=A0A220A3V8_CHIHA|nr:MHC class II antigen beta chain [Chionodraco hamatus]ARD07920.1 MHC class II antigen beta chain [Chionodraco hamatus]
MGMKFSFSLLFLILFFSRADALFGHALFHCQFTSPDDFVYLGQLFFNKVLQLQYNSTLGKYTGYTEKTKDIAEGLNKNPKFIKEEKKNELKCKNHIAMFFDVFLKPDLHLEPSVRVRSVQAASSRHPGMLVCSVHYFFPKPIRVTWLRNGKEVTSDVTSTEKLSNGDWHYQIHSYLEFTPVPGEKITCMVEHAHLMKPKLCEWDPRTDRESENNKIAVGTAGLLLGLVFFVAGLIYFKKKTYGRELVPTNSI